MIIITKHNVMAQPTARIILFVLFFSPITDVVVIRLDCVRLALEMSIFSLVNGDKVVWIFMEDNIKVEDSTIL